MPTCSGSRWTGRPVSSGRVTPGQFHGAEGVQDRRVVADGACALFRTGSFAAGVALVERISAAGRERGMDAAPAPHRAAPPAQSSAVIAYNV
jgi:hypothetical protein